MPSIVIGVLKNDEIVYAKSFGFKDLENFLPADINSVYGIGSITKSFTSLGIILLQDEGKLSVEDYVDKYVNVNVRPNGERIKIWHLMSHTSGIPALGYAEAYIRYLVARKGKYIPIAKEEDVIDFLNEGKDLAIYKPGEKFLYLNEGYVVLGKIIEKVSGTRYEEFIRKKILEKLEMKRTYIDKEVLSDSNVATPYYLEGNEIKRGSFPFGIKADGGILSCVPDMIRYIKGLMNRRLTKSVEEMEKIRVQYPYSYFPGEGYGFGLRITPNFFGKKLIGHGGDVLVYTGYIGYIPEDKLGVVVLSNISSFPLSMIGMYTLALLLGKDPDKELPFIRMLNLLNKLTGKYVSFKETVTAEVKMVGGGLIIKDPFSEVVATYERSEDNLHIFNVEMLGAKMPVYFIEKENEEIFLQYERFLLKKVK